GQPLITLCDISWGYQKLSFQDLKAAKTAAWPVLEYPFHSSAFCLTDVSVVRRKGLVRHSRPIVDGNVMRSCARNRVTSANRWATCGLSGSTALAKRRLPRVYSWAQNTWVAAGSAASRCSEWCICSGVPSNRRPQPAANRVSPQNSSGGWAW